MADIVDCHCVSRKVGRQTALTGGGGAHFELACYATARIDPIDFDRRPLRTLLFQANGDVVRRCGAEIMDGEFNL